MIHYRRGDIFESDADVLVCPCNVVGTLGKGLAKQFKQRYPQLNGEYQVLLRAGALTIIRPCMASAIHSRNICLFPTKFHYNDKSNMRWIRRNLYYVSDSMYDGESIAFPHIGCGLGGLDWTDVHKAFEEVFGEREDREVYIYQQ